MLKELFNLTGRTALVTGGSKGIGKAVARGLAEAGANIAISARHEDELRKAKAEISDNLNSKVEYFVADMNDRAAVKKLAADMLKTFGRCDILINCAGIYPQCAFDDMTFEDWRRVLSINLDSCFLVSKQFVPGMKQRGWGLPVATGFDKTKAYTVRLQVKGSAQAPANFDLWFDDIRLVP